MRSYSEEFKRDAVHYITVRAYMQTRASDRILLVFKLFLTASAGLTIGVVVGLALRLQRQTAEPDKDWIPADR